MNNISLTQGLREQQQLKSDLAETNQKTLAKRNRNCLKADKSSSNGDKVFDPTRDWLKQEPSHDQTPKPSVA